jgi:hypothetical protein
MTELTDEVNQRLVEAIKVHRPQHKTDAFDQLVKELSGDELMAEVMWYYWQADALKSLDGYIPALNTHLRWWKFGQEKNTIRKLIQTPEGKKWVWRMLHDAGAWL